jgi:uncharacterized repeat protein (TIGR04138 family)
VKKQSPSELDWQAVRSRAKMFPHEAFQFIREGLVHTVKAVHGDGKPGGRRVQVNPTDESRHVCGQQLCVGLRDLAVERYGMLARTVLKQWGISSTDDFGTLVYALIDRGELRGSSRDSIEDFRAVYEFEGAFGAPSEAERAG